MTEKSETEKHLSMNESGPPMNGAGPTAKPDPSGGKDLSSKMGVNGDNGTDVPDSLMTSPNNGIHHHHHHHHHNHNQQQQLQPPPVNGGGAGFYEQKSEQQQQEEDDGLGPLPAKWEKAFTDSGEVYFIE